MSARRIEPLPAERWDPDLAELLSANAIAGKPLAEMNIFRTLAHNPTLMRRLMALGRELLLTGSLSGRDRELLILRTAHNCRSDYEWAQHVQIALAEGLTEEEVARVAESSDSWSDHDRLLLTAADELHEQSTLTDATWEALAAGYEPPELIEIVMVVGQYHLVAYALNALGVQVEDGMEPFLPSTPD